MRQSSILLSSFHIRPFIPAFYVHLYPSSFKQDLIYGIDAAHFISVLGLLICTSSRPMSSNQFRRRYLHGLTSLNYTSSLFVRMEKFWADPVSHAWGNVWYRLLHRKIPRRFLLN
ncbi:hypothetical protein G6F57_004951 [Rhizopus arrhizus]|uniref:Uncharacterized protein n=1 Tax=Rhizopus oryzae TaxID=64495 RepID=A0A9P6X0M1_RHIOR|nr:hypothetical protein G6F23_002550 [Rhizopus arrhizus]KAG1421961.1 hypothetical protein G6F58_003517 [Rhizopus delemar]KAG0761889.1 hypothetical protein G6F24_007227 [Rhizopus arrhizus]KAG0784795.1 hypothetical protein G6F22_008176 [Rhizopus arrhizus]KAG0791550.1 hypothetical protein G6F21_005000 [Rhizopus arrhizus]